MLTSLSKRESVNRLLESASNVPRGNEATLISYLLTKQASFVNPEDPEIILKLATYLFKLKFYAQALQTADKWFASNQKDNDPNNRATMFYIKGTCLFHLRKYDVASEYLKKAINAFIQAKDNEMAIEAKRILEEELPKAKDNLNSKPASQKREECVFIKKELELNNLPDVPGKMVYILPADWLEKWKIYNNYHEFMGDENKRTNFMEEEVEKVDWLGPIDPANILVSDPILIDPTAEELYTNLPVKLGLEENRDFHIVNEEVWNFLYKQYGGIPVPRPTYRQLETSMGISVETWLQKINVVMLPIPKKEQPSTLKSETVYISKRKTVKDLMEKLIEIYSGFFPNYKFGTHENRIWKVDPRFELGFAWKRWDGDPSFELHGKVLDENVSIEEAEISNEDTLIFETHFLSKNWFLFDDEVKQKSVEATSSYMALNSIKDFPSGSKKGLTGLQNLGNTCFMNSAIQCLSNTFDLTSFFLTDEYKQDVNKFNPLGSGGKLAYYYSQLMKEVWLGSSSYVSPWDLKKTIGKLASQFVGYGQQDSQELLSYLLDGLHEDLNRVKEKPFIETKEDDTRPDEIVAQESWNNHLKRNQSKIQELMHGQFKSILDCPDCKKVSITFDPFMMISLPIPTVEYTKFFLYFVFNSYDKIPIKITFNMPSNTTYPEMLTKLAKLTKVKQKNIVMGLLKEHKLIEFVGPSADAQYLKDHPGILFAYEIPATSFGSLTDGTSNGATDSSTMNGSSDNSTTAETTKMETEYEIVTPVTALKDSLIRVFIQAEPKAFYESEKTFSYSRLVRFDPSDTYKDIHLKIYERMRSHFNKYFEKQNLKSPIRLEDRSKATIEKEYIKLFPDDNEGQWMYKLYMVNTSKEDPKTGKKPPCDLCQKSKCPRCLLPNDEGRIINYMEKMRVQPKEIIIELKIASKIVKLDNLPLNQCTEFKGDENDETNPNRNYNIYDCINLFTRREKLEKDNAWYCSKCKAHKEALKKMEVYKVPPVLILHLKRFKTQKPSSIGPFYWGQGKKINVTIDFPLNGLDLREYVLGPDRESAVYDLYAVSNHYGGLSGGHYTAFGKNPITNQWYDFNDSRVSTVSEKEVIGPAAYALFYKKREQGSGN